MDTALTILERAVDVEPNRAEAHFWLAEVAGTEAAHRWVMGAFFLAKRSKREFERAVRLDPANPLYLEGLGRFLVRAPGIVGGDRDSARALATNLLRIDRMRGTSLMVEVLWRSRANADRVRADSLIEAFAEHPSGGREGHGPPGDVPVAYREARACAPHRRPARGRGLDRGRGAVAPRRDARHPPPRKRRPRRGTSAGPSTTRHRSPPTGASTGRRRSGGISARRTRSWGAPTARAPATRRRCGSSPASGPPRRRWTP